MSGEMTIEWIASSTPSLLFKLSTQEQECCCFRLFKKKKASTRLNELKTLIAAINTTLTLNQLQGRKDSEQVARFNYKELPNQFEITGFYNFNNALHPLDITKHPKLLLAQEQLSNWLKPTEKAALENMFNSQQIDQNKARA